MAVMITVSSIVEQLSVDYPGWMFRAGEVFSWSPTNTCITYIDESSDENIAQLLHEVAHAVLGHASYDRDIALLKIECQAWDYAVHHLAPHYGVYLTIESKIVQDSLDSYRLWLHQRSICPRCQAVGIESSKLLYRCLHCHMRWQVNEARTCELRRYK